MPWKEIVSQARKIKHKCFPFFRSKSRHAYHRIGAHTCTNHTVPYGTALSGRRCPRHFVPGYDRTVPPGHFATGFSSSVPSPKSLGFRCVQNGSSARREEGAYLDRYVTDEQRSSRPIFNATLRAAASWLFFRVARSTGMIQIQALRSRLEKQPTDLRRNPRDLGDGTLGGVSARSAPLSRKERIFSISARSCGRDCSHRC